LAVKRGTRGSVEEEIAYEAGRRAHYFAERRGRPTRLGQISIQLYGHSLELLTSPGVFSYRRLDTGTRLLIESMEVAKGELVLDLGCGYGPIAVAASLRGAIVAAVDVNYWATCLAARNLERYATAPWLVVWGNLYAPFNARFDAILCNPPIRAGRSTVQAVVEESAKYLRDGGSLVLVARTRMGAKTLSSLMARVFGEVEEVSKKSGYRVLRSRCRGGRVD